MTQRRPCRNARTSLPSRTLLLSDPIEDFWRIRKLANGYGLTDRQKPGNGHPLIYSVTSGYSWTAVWRTTGQLKAQADPRRNP